MTTLALRRARRKSRVRHSRPPQPARGIGRRGGKATRIVSMNYRDIADLIKAAAVNWVRDYAPSMGAALAYYTMFSLAPLLLIVDLGRRAGVRRGRGARRDLHPVAGPAGHPRRAGGAGPARQRPQAGRPACRGGRSAWSLLLVGATTVFAELQDALDRIWRAPAAPGRPGCGAWCAPACCPSA